MRARGGDWMATTSSGLPPYHTRRRLTAAAASVVSASGIKPPAGSRQCTLGMQLGADNGLRDLDEVRVVCEEQHLGASGHLGQDP